MKRPTADEIGSWIGGDATDLRNCVLTWSVVMTLVAFGVITH